jgi:hypothetical protein
MVSESRRLNGFQTPLDGLQICTWVLFPILVTHYFAFLYPLLWDYLAVKVIVTLVFLLSSLMALFGGYFSCAIDPSDDHLLDQSCTENIDDLYCYSCESSVEKTSKHCRVCNKCTVGMCIFIDEFKCVYIER